MKSQGSGDRLTQCIVAAVLLGGLCCAYLAVSSRWLDVDRRRQVLPPSAPLDTEATSQNPGPAGQWFPEHAWLQAPLKTFRDHNRWLFVNQVEPSESDDPDSSGQTFTLSPVAVLWESDDPDEEPIRATASSAVVQLSERIALLQSQSSDSQMGRIVAGRLTGDVRIRGPKNLRVDGREFYIDEKSLTLRSARPISFKWEGHSGTATGGIEIQLAADTTHNPGLFDISDIRSVQLRGRVKCDLHFPARRVEEEDVNLEVTSANGFEFDLHSGLGTFFGYPNRSYTAENQVVVKRRTVGVPDVMLCSDLNVEFHPEISPETGQPVKSRRRLARVLAQGGNGRSVVYISQHHRIGASMNRLEYSVAERRLEMSMSGKDDKGAPLPVTVWEVDPNAPADKMAPSDAPKLLKVYPSAVAEPRVGAVSEARLRFLHAEGNAIERVECEGRGLIRQRVNPGTADDETTPAAVRWTRRMTVQREPGGTLHRIVLEGGSHVTLPRDGMALSARTIDFIVETAERGTDPQQTAAGRPAPEMMSLDLTDAEPRRLEAHGAVALSSPSVRGELSDQLVVRFQPVGTAGRHPGVSTVSATRRTRTTGEGLDRTFGGDGSAGNTSFTAADMDADVILADGRDATWNRVQMSGDVTIRRDAVDPADGFAASGNVMVATNDINGATQMHLFGDPATIRSQSGYVEGARIDLHQTRGTAEINGSGRIQIVADKDFDGNLLPGPVPMDIFWTDSMNLEGRTARFVGNVRVAIKDARIARTDQDAWDIELHVPEMLVHFTQPLRLAGNSGDEQRLSGRPNGHSDLRAGDANESGTPELERVECVGQVTIEANSQENGKRIARHSADLVDLAINMDSGQFAAQGPGWIESTSPGGADQLQVGSAVRAQANTPTEVRESAFARVRASFIKGLEGNLQAKNVTLLVHVKAAFCPVAELDEKIDLETMSVDDMPDDSGLLRADEMVVNAIPGSVTNEFSVTATRNARLESKQLSGDADVITYDSSKEQYILAADDGRTLTVHHRQGNTGRYQTVHGPRFEFYRVTGELSGSVSRIQATD